jgi:hypothetical protein
LRSSSSRRRSRARQNLYGVVDQEIGEHTAV